LNKVIENEKVNIIILPNGKPFLIKGINLKNDPFQVLDKRCSAVG